MNAPADLVVMNIGELVTCEPALHSAWAMGLEHEVGSLAPGKQCDLLLADVPNRRYLSYYCGVNHVSRVLKRGDVVYQRPP